MQHNQLPVFDASAFAGWVSGAAQALPASLCGVTQDSRRVTPGILYVALRGERFDGHDFVAHALQAGAAAAMVDNSWPLPAEAASWPLIRVADTRQALGDAARAWRRACRARIVGLTGSSGKTTTKEMTACLFQAGGAVCATRGNLNNEIGLPLSVLAMPAETDFGIFELGTNHPGEIARLADVLQPEAAIIASIGSAHIEYFGSVEAIAREKGELLRALPREGFAVLCRETRCFDQLRDMTDARVVTTSFHAKDADFFGETLEPLDGTVRVSERESGVQTVLRSGLPGEHNASNLLLAFAAARTSGIAAEAASRALRTLALPGMRWDVTRRSGGVTVVNDAYNANPQSMAAVLKTFVGLPCKGRRIAVLGDMRELGAHAEELHREVGQRVAELAPDRLLAVGPDTVHFTVEEAVKAGYPAARVICAADAAEAARALRGLVASGDCVLLKASRGVGLERVLDEWAEEI